MYQTCVLLLLPCYQKLPIGKKRLRTVDIKVTKLITDIGT